MAKPNEVISERTGHFDEVEETMMRMAQSAYYMYKGDPERLQTMANKDLATLQSYRATVEALLEESHGANARGSRRAIRWMIITQGGGDDNDVSRISGKVGDSNRSEKRDGELDSTSMSVKLPYLRRVLDELIASKL